MFAVSLPSPLFRVYYSPVLYDRNGVLLGAMVAYDGQWRFPQGAGDVNEKFAVAIIEAEDRRFRSHVGVDFLAMGRAFAGNIKSGRIVSGASTITMQTIRLMRSGHRRSLFEKAVEAVLAMRLELSRSKDEILALYAANAPFGANVVGLEAASWRWFGRAPDDLSWAEAATLASLPNGPGLIHPGRNRDVLKQKRDALLARLCARGFFDEESLALAQSEALPGEPLPLPSLSPHLLARLAMEEGGVESFTSEDTGTRGAGFTSGSSAFYTTVDYAIQERSKTIMNRWAARFAEKGIMNGACVILDTQSGDILAYVGNVESTEAPDVDIITAPRSSGSILKPFLYAAMLDSGDILPFSLVSDIPTRVGSYSPENNSRTYLGVIPAGEALARSLNIPAVRSLRLYGIEPFYRLLEKLGVTTLFRKSDDYGLPLILGGAEVTLGDMAGLYAGLARAAAGDGSSGYSSQSDTSPISPGAAWLTLEALTFVVRPGEEAQWQEYAGSRRIAWKTGTSFGNRDAWAIGVTPERTVAVWIGNATGEGRPELTSTTTSAPVLFELFSALDSMNTARSWFPQPAEDLADVEVCAYSGLPPGPDCEKTKGSLIPKNAPQHGSCPYCRTVALNETETALVEIAQGSAKPAILKKWFVLPPAEEWYYHRWNLDYKPLPPFEGRGGDERAGGNTGRGNSISTIALFNPEENAAIFIPREIDGREGRVVFQAAHRNQNGKIYWHLDGTYMGITENFHDMEARPGPGWHTITLVDEAGGRLTRRFEVLNSAD